MTHLGEVHRVEQDYVWIRPLGPLPTNVAANLPNLELYAALTDIADADIVLSVGTRVRFKINIDRYGDVGASDVIAVFGDGGSIF